MWSLVGQQLEIARILAEVDESGPIEAALRRSVSTAYYALFQALCETCAVTLVGRDKSSEAFTLIFRALDHGQVAQTLRQSSKSSELEFSRLGVTFNRLKEARAWADYSPEPRPGYDAAAKAPPYTRSEALQTIEEVEDAIQILKSLDDDTRLKLATRLVTKSRK